MPAEREPILPRGQELPGSQEQELPGARGLGSYHPGKSPIHKLDPRMKAGLMLLLMVSLLIAEGFTSLGLVAILLAAFWAIAGIPPRLALRSLAPAALFALFPCFFNFLFISDGQTILHWAFIQVTDQGVYRGLFMGSRLFLMFASAFLVTLTTTSIAMANGIGRILSPLERFGLPAYEIALMLRIALRFFPDIGQSFISVRRAQLARGAVFNSGGPIRRLRAFLPCLVPLFALCFRNADYLGLAMESRCYHGGSDRSYYREFSLHPADWLAFSIVFLLFVGMIALRVLL